METSENSNGIGGGRGIRKGPVPDWVVEDPYDLDFKSKQDSHLTYLLFERQVHVERRETYVRTAIRLESLEAVQHRSQWRLEFEPQTESNILHTLMLRRAGKEIDQLHLEKGRQLQREEGLDRLKIDGWVTFLLILEDVRVGDILEWSFTSLTVPRILPEYCLESFSLPSWISIGKYHFAVRFDPARAMRWKASVEWKPREQRRNGLTIWEWSGEKYAGLKSEPDTPVWFVSTPLIQISDCPDWRTVSAAVAQLWSKQTDPEDGVLREWVREAEMAGPELAARIDKGIEMVQNNCRYLSINLEFGGQIPTPAATVARRRYGDCKDLSFLLAYLLRQLGVQARPVLVHTVLQKTVGEWLPTLGLFNHAIVEFEAEGKRRWIDPTMKRQGGGAFNRVVPNYGLGLPVDARAEELTAFPEVPEQSHRYEVRETILVDTAGAPSLVALVIRAEGSRAEYQRNEFESKGVEEMERQRLQACAKRFGQAKRVGSLQYHDDRQNNRFITAEVFEISGFLKMLPDFKRCQFQLPSHWVKQTFWLPKTKERLTPFALQHPCHVVHILEIEFPTLRQMSGRQIAYRFEAENPYFKFNRNKKTGYRYWMMTYTIQTTADAVPAEQMEKYCGCLETLWKESTWFLILPVGYSRLKGGRDFGQLPTPAAKGGDFKPAALATAPATSSPEPKPVAAPATLGPTIRQPPAPQPVVPERHRHRHRSKSQRQAGIPLAVKIAGMGVLLVVIIILIAILVAGNRKF